MSAKLEIRKTSSRRHNFLWGYPFRNWKVPESVKIGLWYRIIVIVHALRFKNYLHPLNIISIRFFEERAIELIEELYEEDADSASAALEIDYERLLMKKDESPTDERTQLSTKNTCCCCFSSACCEGRIDKAKTSLDYYEFRGSWILQQKYDGSQGVLLK